MIQIGQTMIRAGERRRLNLEIARLPTDNWVHMPIEVIAGNRSGPTIWLSGAIHGDELIGVEIIRRVLERVEVNNLRGTLIAVPIVNVFGFVDQTRHLPDRRDLNRCFPGSRSGSLASRLANKFMTDIVEHCQYGIDLHTGSNHRANLPQIRGNLDDAETLRCARAFAAPIILNAKNRDGSLREAASKKGIHCLLYEAGEPMRFDASAIRTGERGVMNVLSALNMYGKRSRKPMGRRQSQSLVCGKSSWLRAKKSGILRVTAELGKIVKKGESLGEVSDAFGKSRSFIKAQTNGIVIGVTNNPLVYQGDAVLHIAEYHEIDDVPDSMTDEQNVIQPAE